MAMDWFEFEHAEKDELLVKLKLKTPETAAPDAPEEPN